MCACFYKMSNKYYYVLTRSGQVYKNVAELLKERTSDAAINALELVSKALSISLYSEKLLQMKAEALCLVFSIPIICSTHLYAFLFFFVVVVVLLN